MNTTQNNSDSATPAPTFQTNVRRTVTHTKRGISVIVDIETDKAWARQVLQGLDSRIAGIVAERASEVTQTLFGSPGGENADS